MSKKVLTILFVCLFVIASGAYAQQFSFKSYDFIWHVAKAGKASGAVHKTPKETVIRLGGGGGVDSVNIPPKVAKTIGEKLAETEKMYTEFETYHEDQKR